MQRLKSFENWERHYLRIADFNQRGSLNLCIILYSNLQKSKIYKIQ